MNKKQSGFQCVKTPVTIALISALAVMVTSCGSSSGSSTGSSGSSTGSTSSSSTGSTSSGGSTSSSGSSSGNPVILDGVTLYDMYCQQCHVANGEGSGVVDITGKSASSIKSHIASVGAMNSLDFLTDEQLDALAGYIEAKLDGAALYEEHCDSCHGDGKKGKSAENIKSAIQNVGSMVWMTLSDEEIEAIGSL